MKDPEGGGGGLTVRQVFCLKTKQVVKHCFGVYLCLTKIQLDNFITEMYL